MRRRARIPSLGHLLLALRLQQPMHHLPLHLVLVPAVPPLRAALDVAGAAAARLGQDAVRGDQGVVGVGVVVRGRSRARSRDRIVGWVPVVRSFDVCGLVLWVLFPLYAADGAAVGGVVCWRRSWVVGGSRVQRVGCWLRSVRSLLLLYAADVTGVGLRGFGRDAVGDGWGIVGVGIGSCGSWS